MSAFDELYYRFFRNAVGCHLSAVDASGSVEAQWLALAPVWMAEARSWGLAARALMPYMNAAQVARIEGSVMGGKFTLGANGDVQEAKRAPTTR